MLSKKDIQKELGKGICIYPLHSHNIKENSINLSIGKNAWALGDGNVVKENNKFTMERHGEQNNIRKLHKGKSAILSSGGKNFLILLPHVTTIVETSEVIGVSNSIGGTIHSKVGVANHGVGHIGTMLGPCFCGHMLVALHNITDEVISIPVGETFISVVFYYLKTPNFQNENCNTSGHVEKLSELGVNISPDTRKFLTDDWKCTFDGIRNKMLSSREFKLYKEELKHEKYKTIKGYLNPYNFLIGLVLFIIVLLLGMTANYYDIKHDTNVWSDRFWTVLISGIIIPVILKVSTIFKKK